MAVTLKSMRYFTSALRQRSIAQAAQDLNIAASAVSAAIDQIEAHFELTLVHRHRSRGIEPTASGRAMARKFERLLEDFDSLNAEGAALKNALSGDLKVGYYAPVAPAFLPAILCSLLPPEGDVMADLEECDNDAAQLGLLNGQYDAILFVSNAAHPRVQFDTLIEAPAYCLLPANHPLASRRTIHLQDIAVEAVIVLNRPVASDYYAKLLSTTQEQYRIAAYANSTEMVRSLVGAGAGCAILNMIPATAMSYAGDRLVSLPIADTLPSLTLSIGYDKSNPRRLVQHFVDGCRTFFAGEQGRRCIVQ